MLHFFRSLFLSMAVLLGVGNGPAKAYEYEHYALTYYLAVHIGYSERQAFQIASATFSVDWDPDTTPMPWGDGDKVIAVSAASNEERFRRIWRDFHAFSGLDFILSSQRAGIAESKINDQIEGQKLAREAELWVIGLRQENPGSYMHFHEDREPHSGWADLFGHGPAGHIPDFPSADYGKLFRTAQTTVTALQDFRADMCASYERDYCDRPLREPDWDRISLVLRALVAANRLPPGVIYSENFERETKELTLSFDPIEDSKLRMAQHYVCFLGCSPREYLQREAARLARGQLYLNAGTALYKLQNLIYQNGMNVRVDIWLTSVPGPDPNRSRDVIRNALSHERLNRINLLDKWLLDFHWIELDMPTRWFQFNYSPLGHLTDLSSPTKLEDVRYLLNPDELTIEIEEITGNNGEPAFKALLDFTLSFEGMAEMDEPLFLTSSFADLPTYARRPLSFANELPTLIKSQPDRNDSTIDSKIVGRHGTFHFTHEVEYSVEDFGGQEIEWKITIHGYGLKTEEIIIPVIFPVAQDPPITCNSAVDSGGDEGGGVEVDLGGFTGKAGFTWEMYGIKDQMDVQFGGPPMTTGCVSGSGTFELDIPPGATTAVVTVLPNCEQTTGTAWNFTFECPLVSDVTANGQGENLDQAAGLDGADGLVGQLLPGSLFPSSAGAGVLPALPAPLPVGPTGIYVNETDGNDSIASATPINIGDQVSGSIHPKGEGDYFAISPQHQGELTVSFPNVPAGINIAFRVLNANGNQIWGWQAQENNGASFSGWVDIASPGGYLIEVRDGGSNAGSENLYTMITEFIPTADRAEPNDQFAQATPLDWNQALLANILPRGDGDYYKVQASRRGQVTVNFANAPPGLDMYFRVLNENGNQVSGWQGAAADGDSYIGTMDLPSPGNYMIEVRDGSSNSRSAIPYEIVVSFDPSFDAGEPNDTMANATDLAPETQVWANILPRNDGDFYRVTLAEQGELTVTFNDSPANLDMYFRVLNASGHQIWGWQGAENVGELYSGWADIGSPGDYYVEVRDGGSNERSPDSYQFVLTFRATADSDMEPNDDMNQAVPINLGQAIRASILPRGDGDRYGFHSTSDSIFVVFDQSPPNLDMAFRVLSENGNQVRGWQAAPANGAVFSAEVSLPAAGSYVIEVRDGGSNARSPAAYSFTVTAK